MARALAEGLGEAEFSVPGHVVADIAVDGALLEQADGAINLTIEALTVED